MKICPECALINEERFPTCCFCNTSLAEVRSTPSPDPTHPEHARRALDRERYSVTRWQFGWATLFDMLVITGLAVFPGLVLDPQVLLLYAASAAVVSLAVWQDLAGVFRAGLLQGLASVLLFVCFGPLQPFALIMLVGHVVLTMACVHWMEMIHTANR